MDLTHRFTTPLNDPRKVLGIDTPLAKRIDDQTSWDPRDQGPNGPIEHDTTAQPTSLDLETGNRANRRAFKAKQRRRK